MILVYGDAMVDCWLQGHTRPSPEANSLVFKPDPALTTALAPGGGANAALNAVALYGEASFVAVIGQDDPGQALAHGLTKAPKLGLRLIGRQERMTPVKQRIVADGRVVLRIDLERPEPLTEEAEGLLIDALAEFGRGVKAIVISDYAKGGVSPKVAQMLLADARRMAVPTVIDTKAVLDPVWRGATVLKPNEREICEALGGSINNAFDATQAAKALLDRTRVQAVVLTLGAHGMCLATPEGTEVIDPIPVTALDVTGAGDTVAAALAAKLAMGADIREAARFANAAGAWAVTKPGTRAVTAEEAQALADRYAGDSRATDRVMAQGGAVHRVQ